VIPQERPVSEQRSLYNLRNLYKTRTRTHGAFELHVPRIRVRQGEILVIQGASGCGKSTLLDIFAMTLQPDRAEQFDFVPNGRAIAVWALWHRRDLDQLSRLRSCYIGYVLQTGGLLPFLTVRRNIALPLRLLGLPVDSTVERLAERLGIAEHLDRLPQLLSVGERQRVAIARALVHRPRLILADEPTASVDPLTASAIFQVFAELVDELGITALIASHDWLRTNAAGFRVLEHRIERDGLVTRSQFWN
jgi:putative ABC transport system ATP-binding protein